MSPQKKSEMQPDIQGAFIAWLATNKNRFLVPVSVGTRTNHSLDILLGGVNPIIKISLNNRDLVAEAELQGKCIDFLFSFESCPTKLADGSYYCELCADEAHRVFESLEDLWTDHLFEPFVTWVNEKLVPSPWLSLNDLGGATYAMLLQEKPATELVQTDDSFSIVVPTMLPEKRSNTFAGEPAPNNR